MWTRTRVSLWHRYSITKSLLGTLFSQRDKKSIKILLNDRVCVRACVSGGGGVFSCTCSLNKDKIVCSYIRPHFHHIVENNLKSKINPV